MKQFFRSVITAIFISLIMVSCSTDNKPAKSEIKAALSENLVDYVVVNDFSFEASENIGNKVEPIYATRFTGTISLLVDLYKEDKDEGDVLFVKRNAKKGDKINIFGKSISTLYQGKWIHNISIDGNPIHDLGFNISQNPDRKIIIIGSDEEKQYIFELRNNLLNANKILVGKWRYQIRYQIKDDTYIDNNIITFKPDGTYFVDFDVKNTLVKNEYGRWNVVGDNIVKIGTTWIAQSGMKFGGGDRGDVCKIINLDNDKVIVKTGCCGGIMDYCMFTRIN